MHIHSSGDRIALGMVSLFPQLLKFQLLLAPHWRQLSDQQIQIQHKHLQVFPEVWHADLQVY